MMPLSRITRWQGISTATGLLPTALPTARAALVWPMAAAMLHDVGMIAIPPDVLKKSGALTPDERALVRRHPSEGGKIVEGAGFPALLPRIIREHHERMDGSGYPNGLSGDEICEEARILAVADVIEAMTSDRPYRPAPGLDAALAEIEARRGVLYDPRVADACVTLFREGRFDFPPAAD